MLNIAFKEWAAVCDALALGRQSLIIRKGGIAEDKGEFRPEHDTFLLQPTYFHEQQQMGLKPTAADLLARADMNRPQMGTIRFGHFAKAEKVIKVEQLEPLLKLEPLHVWTNETVMQRFHYRWPGLYVFIVRVYALPTPVILPDEPEYAGCKTWVPLRQAISIDGAKPVLSDSDYEAAAATVMAVLNASK
ncbi:MAG: DUF1802 family protein [Gemmataceae bacterium]